MTPSTLEAGILQAHTWMYEKLRHDADDNFPVQTMVLGITETIRTGIVKDAYTLFEIPVRVQEALLKAIDNTLFYIEFSTTTHNLNLFAHAKNAATTHRILDTLRTIYHELLLLVPTDLVPDVIFVNSADSCLLHTCMTNTSVYVLDLMSIESICAINEII